MGEQRVGPLVDRPGEQRRRRVLDQMRQESSVRAADLAQRLGVSVETVRRDLQILEDRGLVRRTPGGAHALDRAGYETAVVDRSARAGAEKMRVARATVPLLEGCRSVYIDEGSTAMAVAEHLLTTSGALMVVTHALPVAMALTARDDTEILVLGGRIRRTSMAGVGPQATRMLADLVVDAVVLSASGISLEFGLSTSDPEVADLKRAAVAAARRRVFVGDSTKFGVTSFCRYAGVQELDVVVTDTGLPERVAARYDAEGARVVHA